MAEKLKQIILKADDRGSNLAINQGIDELVRRGLITDPSLIIHYTGERERDTLLEAINESPLKENPGVGILLHVNLTAGKPLCSPEAVSSLVDSEGRFIRPNTSASAWKEHTKRFNPDEVKREVEAQVKRFYLLFGRYPNSLDCHNMAIHTSPGFEVALEFATQLQIPMAYPKRYSDRSPSGPFEGLIFPNPRLWRRVKEAGIPTPDYAVTEMFNRFKNFDYAVRKLVTILENLQPGVTEFYFHPGHPDYAGIDPDPRFVPGRVRDFSLLTDPRVVKAIGNCNLTSYKKLASRQ